MERCVENAHLTPSGKALDKFQPLLALAFENIWTANAGYINVDVQSAYFSMETLPRISCSNKVDCRFPNAFTNMIKVSSNIVHTCPEKENHHLCSDI